MREVCADLYDARRIAVRVCLQVRQSFRTSLDGAAGEFLGHVSARVRSDRLVMPDARVPVGASRHDRDDGSSQPEPEPHRLIAHQTACPTAEATMRTVCGLPCVLVIKTLNSSGFPPVSKSPSAGGISKFSDTAPVTSW